MSIRTFWTILIKILGLYVILESLTAIPMTLIKIYGVATQFSQANIPDDSKVFIAEAVFYISVFIVYFLVFRYCIFYTDWIIDKLRLDQGFKDERLDLNMHRSSILKIVVMVIGGALLVDSFPLLCSQVISYFKEAESYKKFTDSREAKYIIIYFLKTFIGYFMLTCSRMIVNYIELKRKKPITNTEEPGL